MAVSFALQMRPEAPAFRLTHEARLATLVKMLDETPRPRKTLFNAVSRLAETWHTRYRQEMARRGFPWHLTAVGDLLDHLPPEGALQSSLATRTGLSKQAVQQSLDQLEQHGVIRREIDPLDKRVRHIVFTELGLRNLHERQAVLDEIEASARSALGKATAKRLRKTLRRLV
jgi:DNA-binding MarR family transcriptional regulator